MAEPFHRYCDTCGARFALDAHACPQCGTNWSPSPPRTIASAKATLETLQEWHAEGIIPAEAFGALQARAEADLQGAIDAAIRPTRESATAAPPPPITEAIQPSLPPGPDFGAILSERQADILLYLGAFLLGMAALIFVSYQDGTGNAAVRVAVLAGYTVASTASGLLVRRWDRVREAGHVFLGLGALLVPLNFVLLYTEVLRDRDVPLDAVWLYGSVFSGALYAALAWRGFGRLYRIPAGIAVLSAWISLSSVVELPLEWFGAWLMLLAGAVAAIGAPKRKWLVICGGVPGGFALAWAYVATFGDHPWQLPATHAIATAATAWSAYRFRSSPGLGAVLLLGAGTVSAAMWVLDAPPATLCYPLLLSGVGALVMARANRGWTWPWWYTAAMALTSLPGLDPEGASAGWRGLGCFGSAALASYLAWKNVDHGFSTSPVGNNEVARTLWGERLVYALAAAAFALGGTILLQEQVGIGSPENGALLTVLAAAPAVAVMLFPRLRSDHLLAGAIPISAAAAFAALPTDGDYLYAAAYLAVPGAAWFGAFALSGRWVLAVTGAAFFVLAAFGVRAEYASPYWQLALAFAGAGLLLFVTLEPFREYGAPSERPVCAIILSWGLHAVALLVAVASLFGFLFDRVETGRDLVGLLVERGDYRAIIVLVLLLAVLIGRDGWRSWGPLALLPATAVGLAGVLMTIGLANPSNVQAYTAPVGLYLLAIGLWVQRSPDVAAPHLQLHEVATVAGAAFIVFPQVEQSFDPGGGFWGLVLIGEGLGFLVVGLLFAERWLVPVGTLVLGGVAMRFLLESSDTVPYWLSLGLLGTLLLAAGLFVLLNAEWWAATRRDAVRWWQRAGEGSVGTLEPPPPRAGE